MAVTRYAISDNQTLAWSTVSPSAGDLILMFFANDGGDNQTTPSGWTRLDSGDGAVDVSLGAYYRVATGTETGNLIDSEATFGVSAEEYAAHVLKIPAAEWSGQANGNNIVISAKQEASSGAIDIPSLNIPWPDYLTETLYVLVAARDDDDGISSLTGQAGFSGNFLRTAGGTSGPEIATSYAAIGLGNPFDPPAGSQTGTAEAVISFAIGVRESPWWEVSDWSEPVSATTLPEARIGAAAVSQAPQTASAEGSHTPPVFQGSAAASQASQSASAAGSVAPPVVVGSAVVLQAPQTASGAGAVVPPTVEGSAAAVQADQTAAGVGAAATTWVVGEWSDPVVVSTPLGLFAGGGAAVQSDDESSASGWIEIIGDVAVVVGPDVADGAGVLVAPITGGGEVVQESDSGFLLGFFSLDVSGVIQVVQADQVGHGEAPGTWPEQSSLDLRSWMRFR